MRYLKLPLFIAIAVLIVELILLPIYAWNWFYDTYIPDIIKFFDIENILTFEATRRPNLLGVIIIAIKRGLWYLLANFIAFNFIYSRLFIPERYSYAEIFISKLLLVLAICGTIIAFGLPDKEICHYIVFVLCVPLAALIKTKDV